MPVKHSPPAKNTRSQGAQAVLTPTLRAPLDHTPSVNQMSENLDKGVAPSRRGGPRGRLEEAEDEVGEDSVEEEETEAPEMEGAHKASEARNMALSNYPLVSQAEPNFLKMMEQMTQFIGHLTKAVFPRDNSRAPAFNTP
ncbi:hypothetical protein O181_039832 [Austropuccinia psidii MF-1]|uniref:Uncharacterized protein n=1 Tax=Austropuccinia psidii MF-1 TaxID=1389203 RepID=A0A9Q3DHK1_9BASI|nr:hypothetical protein [Austropuccinia psidii MF-1]